MMCSFDFRPDIIFFFFSSRRRHTRLQGDWSSDVCSSDLWQMQGLTGDHLILRLIDRGDWVAQVAITPWTKAQPGEHLTPEAFQEAMAATPGWEPEQILQASEVPLDGGRWCYRISAL